MANTLGFKRDFLGGFTSYEEIAIHDGEALYPFLRQGLLATFSPVAAIPRLFSIDMSEDAMSDRNYDFSPVGPFSGNWNENGLMFKTAMTREGPDTSFESIAGGHWGSAVRSRTGAADGELQAFGGQAWQTMPAPVTMHTYVKVRGTADPGHIWCSSGRGSIKTGGNFYGRHIGVINASGIIYFVGHNNSGTTINAGGQGFQSQSASAPHYVDGDALNIIVATETVAMFNGNPQLWLNGTSLTLDLINNDITPANNNAPRICGSGNNNFSQDMAVTCVEMWNRILTEPEILLLSADPYALYRKRPEIDMGLGLSLLDDEAAALKVVTIGGPVVRLKRVLAG